MLHFRDVIAITGGTVVKMDRNLPVQHLLTDSRQLTSPLSSLFFAIQGERHDGHLFIEDLYARGVRQFVVETHACTKEFLQKLHKLPSCNIAQVTTSQRALQQIAAFHRSHFTIPIIGITGSNGKTIVKEWLAQLLSAVYTVAKSPKSYNSQIGVPLSVWQLNEVHTLGIFEAGISKPEEMEYLQSVIHPTIGLFTNIGSAHDEGFLSRQEKVAEKMKLFSSCHTLVYCQDYPEIDAAAHQLLTGTQNKTTLFAWSRSHPADLQITELHKGSKKTQLLYLYQGNQYALSVPFIDEASIENALHCVATMLVLGLDANLIDQQIQLLRPISMRLELKEGIHGCYIIDDTYNNDLAGLTMALDFLNLQKQRTKKVLILSDVLESGLNELELYQRIGQVVSEKGVDELVGIGAVISRNRHSFQLPSSFYVSTKDFLANHDTAKFSQSILLVKGARKFLFERIVSLFQQKTHGTVLEINLDAISHNLNHYRNKLGNHTKIMVMVKAFAYGSGSAEVASLLQFHRVDYLAVAYVDEGVTLRENGVTLPIMVLNPSEETFEKLLAYQLEPEIYSFRILNSFLQFLETTQQTSPIHIKLDTGMHRLGFEEKDIESLSNQLKANHQIHVATIFSHMAAADEEIHNEFSKEQLNVFSRCATTLEAELGYTTTKHMLNSAGIVRFPNYKMDMVRLGIGLYGVEVNGKEQDNLLTVGTLKTVISQIKYLKPGETVGYGRHGKVDQELTIATIAIGYADGYDRRFGKGTGRVLINGVLCPIIGNVCMDMTMVDISKTTAQEGDEAIIFGKELTISQVAKSIDTIPYEILTGVSERVKRVFYKE